MQPDQIMKTAATSGFAKLLRLGFAKESDLPVAFANGCTVSFYLQDGEWEVSIVLPNGQSFYIYATPENVEVEDI